MVRGRDYPGIVETRGAATPGLLYLEVDLRSLSLLDRFEGAFYERRPVAVTTGKGESLDAWAWVVPVERRHLLSDEPWDRARFERDRLPAYLAGARTGEARRGG